MNRRWTACALAFAALVPACTGGKSAVSDDFNDLAQLDEKSDAFSYRMKVLGTLAYGETAEVNYTKSPRYRAYKFSGKKGDQVDVWVRSTDGDPVTWVLSSKYATVASNDDADDTTTDSHVSLTLTSSKTYYIVVRDYYLSKATFSVSLTGPVADLYACQTDADCVATPQGGCCPHGEYVAVNKDSVDAYNQQTACTANPRPYCPLFLIHDDRVAECNAGTGKCEMVEPTDIACGGFTRNPHSCPTGYSCQFQGVPDVPGKCVADPAPQTCGGFAGIACPAGQECVDDPTDNCDPANGGADCSGICQPKTCVQTQACILGSHWDSQSCQCVPDTTADCQSTGCGSGEDCVYCWGSYACIPHGALC